MIFTNLNIYSITIFFIIFFLIFFIFIFYLKKYKKLEKKFFLLYKNKSFKKFFFKNLLIFLAIITLIFAIFGIKTINKNTLEQKKGLDIVFVLDVSKSMNSVNGKNGETRLDFAKNMIKNYIIKHNYNRYSLIIFAGDTIAVSPLTTNYSVFFSFLDSVNYKNIKKQGTNFNKAFEFAIKRFSKDSKNKKVIIFISDGADPDTKIDEKFLKKLKNKNIFVQIIGVGTKKQEKIFEGKDAFGDDIFAEFNGEVIKTKLNEKNLKKLANIFDGEYFNSISDIDKNIDLIEKKAILKTSFENKNDFTKILIIISFLLFFSSLFIKNYKGK